MPAPIIPARRAFSSPAPDTLRPRLAGVDLVELEPEGADHVLRHLAGGQLGEIARLDQLRGVEIDLGALHRRAHDLLGRREATLGLVAQHRRCDGQHLRHVGTGRRTAGNLVAGAVPGLLRRRVGEDPGAGLLQHFLGAVGRSWISPALSASAGRTFLPSARYGRAFSRPSSRTMRTIPPPPGNRPRVTSGRPSCTPGLSRAMRWWQARQISQPPPSAAPLIAATTGLPRVSRRRSWP